METHEEQLTRVEQKIDAMYKSVEKTRKYILTMLIASIVMVVLPILMAIAIVPIAMSSLGSIYSI